MLRPCTPLGSCNSKQSLQLHFRMQHRLERVGTAIWVLHAEATHAARLLQLLCGSNRSSSFDFGRATEALTGARI